MKTKRRYLVRVIALYLVTANMYPYHLMVHFGEVFAIAGQDLVRVPQARPPRRPVRFDGGHAEAVVIMLDADPGKHGKSSRHHSHQYTRCLGQRADVTLEIRQWEQRKLDRKRGSYARGLYPLSGRLSHEKQELKEEGRVSLIMRQRSKMMKVPGKSNIPISELLHYKHSCENTERNRDQLRRSQNLYPALL